MKYLTGRYQKDTNMRYNCQQFYYVMSSQFRNVLLCYCLNAVVIPAWPGRSDSSRRLASRIFLLL